MTVVLKPPSVVSPLNMTTGPVALTERVRQAQAASFVTPHCDTFWELHERVVQMLRHLMSIDGDLVVVPGSITNGLDLAISSIVFPGMKVVALENGFWGRLVGEMCRFYGADVVRVTAPAPAQLDLDTVDRVLHHHTDALMVTGVHVETSSGTINPAARIGSVVKKHNRMFLLDSACSAGIIDLSGCKNVVDIHVTGSQKGLCSAPGLALVSFTACVREHITKFRAQIPTRQFNVISYFNRIFHRGRPPNFTLPATLFYALAASLDEIFEIGTPAWFDMHERAATCFKDELHRVGLELMSDASQSPGANERRAQSDSVMAVRYPLGIDDQAFRRMMQKEYGLFVLGNLGEFFGKSFRVGLMSLPQINTATITRTVEAAAECMTRLRT